MFSRRTPHLIEGAALADAARALRAAGDAFDDLTESNPTHAGFRYPDGLLAPLGTAAGLDYAPEAFGRREAREAVAADYVRRGVGVAPERVVLTASTSESYSFLFKLLCDPGDTVLVPQPSYPLFEYLTRLDGIEGRPYRLDAADGWQLDPASLAPLIDARTRAVLVVTPNNPTGTRLRRDALRALARLCASRGLAVIGDEVFADYTMGAAPGAARSVLEQPEALTFSLGGLSKTVGLPQLKLGWIAAGGPHGLVDEALARLEIVADAYLSVSTPVQIAAGELLAAGAPLREAIAGRVRANYASLVDAAAACPACRVPPVEGGWSAVVQAPAVMPDESRALGLLREQRVLVHPGRLFDFEREGYFVVSLLPPSDVFAPAARRVLAALEAS